MQNWRTYLFAALAGLAVAMFALACPAGNWLGSKFGPAILNAAKGKIADPAAFVTGRMVEGSLLLGLAIGLGAVYAGARKLAAHRPNGWMALVLTAFAAVNIWFIAAMQTAALWIALSTGGAASNLAQFHFKEELLREHQAERQILLLGSSQTQAQIDENILNQELDTNVWTTELHFPGSRSLDLLLVLRRLEGAPGDDLICYLSEYYFYPGLYTTTAPYFANLEDIPLLKRIGFGREIFTQPYGMGFLGDVLPLFACREAVSQRLLGSAVTSLEQAKHDTALETNLVRRAEEWAQPFKLNEDAKRQKNAFLAFVEEAARQNRRLILLEGQVNPILSELFPPELRPDMKQFLRQVAAEHPHVTLIPEAEMPRHESGDYKDLTHIVEERQAEFSRWLAGRLRRLEGAASVASR